MLSWVCPGFCAEDRWKRLPVAQLKSLSSRDTLAGAGNVRDSYVTRFRSKQLDRQNFRHRHNTPSSHDQPCSGSTTAWTRLVVTCLATKAAITISPRLPITGTLSPVTGLLSSADRVSSTTLSRRLQLPGRTCRQPPHSGNLAQPQPRPLRQPGSCGGRCCSHWGRVAGLPPFAGGQHLGMPCPLPGGSRCRGGTPRRGASPAHPGPVPPPTRTASLVRRRAQAVRFCLTNGHASLNSLLQLGPRMAGPTEGGRRSAYPPYDPEHACPNLQEVA